jgi:hypothetical protein
MADLAAAVALENKGQGTPSSPKPESRGGHPAAPAPEYEAAEPKGKISFDGQGGIGEGRLLDTPKGVVRTGRETRSTLTGPRPNSNPTRATVSSGVPQGPGTLLPTPIRIMCKPCR